MSYDERGFYSPPSAQPRVHDTPQATCKHPRFRPIVRKANASGEASAKDGTQFEPATFERITTSDTRNPIHEDELEWSNRLLHFAASKVDDIAVCLTSSKARDEESKYQAYVGSMTELRPAIVMDFVNRIDGCMFMLVTDAGHLLWMHSQLGRDINIWTTTSGEVHYELVGVPAGGLVTFENLFDTITDGNGAILSITPRR